MRRKLWRGSATLLAGLLLAGAAPAPFDAAAAWREFAELLRLDYGYLERPGIDGPAILAHFAPAARAAPDRAAFINVLQTVARNFADPHFVIGPLGADDPSVIPTGSDLHATFGNDRFAIVEVRTRSDAARAGIVPGASILEIDGEPPRAAVARLLGRPFAELSAQQIVFALNVALAGIRNRPRSLTLRAAGADRAYTLRPTYEHAGRIDAAPRVATERRGRVGIVRLNNSLGQLATIAEFRAALAALADTEALVIDLRNTPSGGNTTVARGIMGHFVRAETPYQVHVIPSEQRRHGAARKFVEYVLPAAPFYPGMVFAVGGRWTGSMGEGMMLGFDALGAKTVGASLGGLLGALSNVDLPLSGAKVDLGTEILFHPDGTAREAFRPRLRAEPAEAHGSADPALTVIERTLPSSNRP